MSTASLVLQDGRRLPLAAGQRVGLTVQANDLLKADSVQADYSSTLTLADTPEVRQALEQAQHGPALTDAPYQQLPCTLEAGGLEVLPGAVAIVEQHQTGEGFEAQVLGGNKSFYAAIEGKKLRELQFPAGTEHPWTLASAVKGAAHTRYTDTTCYDLYDRGKGGARGRSYRARAHRRGAAQRVCPRRVGANLRRRRLPLGRAAARAV